MNWRQSSELISAMAQCEWTLIRLHLILLVSQRVACEKVTHHGLKRHVGDKIFWAEIGKSNVVSGLTECREKCTNNYGCKGVSLNDQNMECDLFRWVPAGSR